MREIYSIDHNDDGTITVKFVDFRVETYSDKNDIAAISSMFREQRAERESNIPRFPSLIA